MRLQFTDLTIDNEDSPQMEMKCTNHASQMVTDVEDGPAGGKKMFKESCSQSMSTGTYSLVTILFYFVDLQLHIHVLDSTSFCV